MLVVGADRIAGVEVTDISVSGFVWLAVVYDCVGTSLISVLGPCGVGTIAFLKPPPPTPLWEG